MDINFHHNWVNIWGVWLLGHMESFLKKKKKLSSCFSLWLSFLFPPAKNEMLSQVKKKKKKKDVVSPHSCQPLVLSVFWILSTLTDVWGHQFWFAASRWHMLSAFSCLFAISVSGLFWTRCRLYGSTSVYFYFLSEFEDFPSTKSFMKLKALFD